MFEFLKGVGAELRGELIEVYWVLLVPLVVFLLVLELIKRESPNVREIIRRIVISVLLLITFDWAVDAVATIGDAVTERIDGLNKLSEVLAQLSPNQDQGSNLFSLKDTAMYVFSLAAYIIAYVGFFTATALTHFIWTILYVCSPLMILMYVSPKTSHITMSLYKGLVQVVVWRILYSILGVLLLKLALQSKMNTDATGLEDYLLALVVNLCIGISMLFIPIATKSLIGDGLNSLATTLAMAPAVLAAGSIKIAAMKAGAKTAVGTKDFAKFAAKPLSNPVTGRLQLMKERLSPKVEALKKDYSSIGLPKELKTRKENKTFKK